jgi:hypothetical protein
MCIPDNYDRFEEYEAEQERLRRQRERQARDWEQVEHGLLYIEETQE